MSTIDDAAKLSKALKLPNSAIVYLFDDVSPKDGLDPVETAIDLLNTVPKLITEARAQEQEIARLQDQLATARKGLERLWPKWTAQAGAPIAQWVCAEEIRELLAAIPLASDCELLLEEARVLIEILHRSATPSEYWRIKIDDFFAKFPK